MANEESLKIVDYLNFIKNTMCVNKKNNELKI